MHILYLIANIKYVLTFASSYIQGIFSCMCVNARIAKGSSRFLAVKPTAFQIKWIHVLLREDLQLKTYPDLQSVHPVSCLWLIPCNEGNKQVCESVNIYLYFTSLHWLIWFICVIYICSFLSDRRAWSVSLFSFFVSLRCFYFNTGHVSWAHWLFNEAVHPNMQKIYLTTNVAPNQTCL